MGLELLPSAYRELAERGLQLSLDEGAGLPRVPSRSATPTLAGSFIAEGSPFPVRQLGFTSQQLRPKKLAVGTMFSAEVAKASQVNVEAVLRDEIISDTSVVVDSVLLSAAAATTTTPGGLRAGVSGLTVTASGTAAEKMTADLKLLFAGIAPAVAPVLIVNSAQALTIASVYQSEVPALIVSPNVPSGLVTAIDANAFATASRLPSFSISTEAVVHQEDTSPLPISSGAPGLGEIAAPTRSLWQTDCLMLRMIWRIDWTLRRTGAVAWMTSVGW